MNKDFLNQIPADEQPVAKKLQSVAEDVQLNASFQAELESQLRKTHAEKSKPTTRWQARIIPSLGWAILIIGAVILLNWALRSLVPVQLPAANGTPDSNIPFESNVKTGNICQGQLTVSHEFSVFLSNQDKTGFIELDKQKEIGELRSFSWSPDGKQLAIVGNTRGSGNLYLTDATGSSLQPVLSNSELGYLVGVAWSRDGQRLLTWQIDKNTRLYLMNKDGAGLTEIDLPVQIFETPQFAPGNESVLFYGADESTDGLFQVSIDGSQVKLVSDMVKSESSFAWSKDGSRLAYIEKTSGSSKARIVIENGVDGSATETYPIQVGTGISTEDSANLSWSPDGENLVLEFRGNGAPNILNFRYVDGTNSWIEAHAPAISADGRCLAYIRNQQVFLSDLTTDESSSTQTAPVLLANLPMGRGSSNTQLDKLQWLPEPISVPDTQDQVNVVPTPSGIEYDWRGIKLYQNAPLPDAPTQVELYEVQQDRHATLDSARALAGQFGMNGQIYETPSEIGDSETNDFLVVDGNQRLRVRSNLYFSYYPDYPRWDKTVAEQKPDQSTAESLIESFLRSHGFDFDYKVENTVFQDGYYALPLTPEGLTIHHNHFSSAGFLFRFDQNEILAVEANLVTYSLVDNFGVITAEKALQRILDFDSNATAGILEGGHSVRAPIQTWYRPRPENQTVTVWGWISSIKSAEGGAPLVTFDGYQATGNLAGLAESTPNTFVEATGQFQTVDGNKVFNVESWQIFDGREEGLVGTIQQDGDQVVILTSDGFRKTLPDMPADIPIPMENAFVLGVPQGDVFEWKSIDTRMQRGGGGGGGGGGSGFYKPNLTGTPVPLPTPQAMQSSNPGSSSYSVQEGDTLSGIAESYGTTVDELMQANGLEDATIYIGQTLIIPGAQDTQPPTGQRLDGQRGTLLITIVNKLDGSQSVDYRLQIEEGQSQYQMAKLEGDGLEELQTHNNLPVDIWGTVERYETDFGMQIPVVNVERFEFPYPDLQIQILKGTQSIVSNQGESVTLLTTEDGQTYAQANGYGGLLGKEGDQVSMEALVLPDQFIAGYPVIRVFSAGMTINPKSGEPVEMQVTANKPYVNDETERPDIPSEITATIESIELVYFMPKQRYAVPDPTAAPVYIQPAWRFQGYYSDGSEFEILVQALKDEFLLPEIERIEPPG